MRAASRGTTIEAARPERGLRLTHARADHGRFYTAIALSRVIWL